MDGRDYGYAIDRARFDDALWRLAARRPVGDGPAGLFRDRSPARRRARDRCARPHDRRAHGNADGGLRGGRGRPLQPRGAQGGAREHDEHAEYPTTLYYAYWQGAAPYDAGGPTCHIYAPGYGLGFLIMDSADGSLCVAVEGQSAIVDPGSAGAEAFYMDLLRRYPRVWRRLAGATRVTDVRGMRKVGNLYRQAGGPGWALRGRRDPPEGSAWTGRGFTTRCSRRRRWARR